MYLQLKYTVAIPHQISIFRKRVYAEQMVNDEVSSLRVRTVRLNYWWVIPLIYNKLLYFPVIYHNPRFTFVLSFILFLLPGPPLLSQISVITSSSSPLKKRLNLERVAVGYTIMWEERGYTSSGRFNFSIAHQFGSNLKGALFRAKTVLIALEVFITFMVISYNI